MDRRDNAPPPPDWTPNAGNLCGTCLGTANLCHVLRSVDSYPCCEDCTHGTQTMREPDVQLWDGDQA